jgi:RsiW-degrading membrane proteinase PrsW (M82 family)
MVTQDARTYVRGGAWRSAALTLVALMLFVALVVGVDAAFQPVLTGIALTFTGVAMALVPAALWLVFFYLQDRLEPEPKSEVARIFVIGLALAGAIGLPLVGQVFRLPEWQYRDASATVLGAIFVAGTVEAFIIYATVRYFIYGSAEFNERTDGAIYGMAAGLGYATALNVQFILTSGGAALGAGEVYMAEVALAHAAFGGVLGYFLGRAKLEREPVWWLPSGLLLTALLNGLFAVLRSQVEAGQLVKGPPSALPSVAGLALAGVLGLVVALVLAWLISRDVRLTATGQRVGPAADAAVGDRQANYAVIALFVVLMLIGGVAWYQTEYRTTAFEAAGFRGSYPAHFGVATGPDDVLRVVDVLGTQSEFTVKSMVLQEGQDAHKVISLLAVARSADCAAYQVVGTEEATWHDRPALVHRFACVEPLSLQRSTPRLLEGVDTIIVDGDRAVVITMLVTPEAYASVEPLFARFVDGLSF